MYIRIKKYFKRKLKTRYQKAVAFFLLITILNSAVFPTASLALTGGPSQPEVQSFEPVGTSDMVDLFTGDFNYNIPLMDVDGYPINISYHGGVGMDQEASWVGLGWNINPGVINRGMRGIPDDFDGDVIKKTYNLKPNRTYGITGGLNAQLFGYDNLSGNFSLGVRYNNYTGVAIEKSISLSVTAGLGSSSALTSSLGLTSSSDEGLTIQPNVSFSARQHSSDNSNTASLGISAGASYNSRAGLKTLSINVNASVAQNYRNSKAEVKSNNLAGENAAATWDFGMPTFTPQVSMPMHNSTYTGTFQLGGEIFGLDGSVFLSGYYSQQKLITNEISSPAYGYNNLDDGQNLPEAMLDFNREKDGTFNENTPALPITNLTYDIYSVSGQGIGGSYRPFRSDIGYVYDSKNYSTTENGSLTVDVGIGAYFHGGTDFSITDVDANSGAWTSENLAVGNLKYSSTNPDPLYEKVYYKEANEKVINSDPSLFQQMGKFDPLRFELNEYADFYTVLGNNFIDQNGGTHPINTNKRTKRDKRNQEITFLKRDQYNEFAIQPVSNLYPQAPGHHTAEITALGTDGSRYVYGVAAYNILQEEATFAVGADEFGNGGYTGNCLNGLVNMSDGQIASAASVDNNLGIDNYYNSVETPAYAHSYMLTAILSPDYVDADIYPGPSDGDLGNYTKIEYTKINNYKWRTPATSATYNEGLKSDNQDDKANFVYGEKELYYVSKIITKNYVAVFELTPRRDGHGVLGRNGGVDGAHQNMYKLSKISLYTKPNYNENQVNSTMPLNPIKEVHFEYDYSLCPKVENNDYATEIVGDGTDLNSNHGKLTLKKIYFSYQNSNKAKLSPYRFEYNGLNPDYNIKAYDRWGNFKASTTTSCGPGNQGLPNSEFPYTEQNKVLEDSYASAWSLTDIFLPSGGKIKVDYESDDYAYVQNERAMQMFGIYGIQSSSGGSAPPDNGINDRGLKSLVDGGEKLYFRLVQDNQGNFITDASQYFNGNVVYFRFLMEMNNGNYEYIPGYAQVHESYIDPSGFGWVQFENVKLNDNGNANFNPIVKAAIQYGRMNMPKKLYQQPNIPQGSSFGVQVLQAIANSSFAQNISQAISGANKAIYDNGYCQHFIPNKSFIRLLNPNKRKLGGGARVKSIKMSDEWSTMLSDGGSNDSFEYGQEYSYAFDDKTSSGVASYEPQIGGDENPFRKPVFYDIEKALSPDDQLYTEEPFGESFFPSPSVGYSMVTVKNLGRQNVTKHATGKIVHEFYTAKQFPTIVERTDLVHDRDKSDPLSIQSLLNIDVKDYVTATQGFVVETNDMHGKPKSQKVYQEGQITPITEVEYIYKSTNMGNGTFKLDNTVTAILPNGNIDNNAQVGVMFDMVADMREQRSVTNSSTIPLNLDVFPIPFAAGAPLFVFMVWPSFSHQETQFRSATTTKVVQRFGILQTTVAKDLGSVVSTNNLAYDSETGEVLLTQTKTDFEDAIYTMNFPAHWYYDGMGHAYKNIGLKMDNVNFSNIANAKKYFIGGDEISIDNSVKGWITNVTSNSISVVDIHGAGITGTHSVKVLRSGRKNMPSVSIGSIAGLNNPIAGLTSNLYEKVLQSSAIEFSDEWKIFCDCPETGGNGMLVTTNPYILGTKGRWKPQKSYLHLTDRTQSKFDGNTNIRKDGIFTSYTPFYKNVAGGWQIDYKNWTYTSEVTITSPYGPELENRDALGRYSSATFGYNQSLATSVAANTSFRELGFDNFEDYNFSVCADNHFKFPKNLANISKSVSHTGKKSIKVSAGLPISMIKQIDECVVADCNIKFIITHFHPDGGGPYLTNVTATGGSAPYNFTYNVISGSPTFSLSNNSTTLNIHGHFVVEVTVSDSRGCTYTQTLQY